MDDGELDQMNPSIPNCGNFDDDLRNTKKCTHSHTCNPPGPAIPTHTHTCYHTHTRVLSTGKDDPGGQNELNKPTKKLLGNREAVKKYREKKRAHEAYLEEEVKKLRHTNQQLSRTLERRAALEAEILRLKCLLIDLRAKIDAELVAVFPFQKMCSGDSLRCGCSERLMGGVEAAGLEGSCFPAVEDCRINQIAGLSLNLDVVDGVKVGGNMLSGASQANLIA